MLPSISSPLSVIALGLGLGGVVSTSALAASPATAPVDLVRTLDAIEAAANSQNLEQVMNYYSENFSSDTGFDQAQLRETLSAFWQQYGNLTYDIELVSWEASGDNAYTVETLTQVEGSMVRPERRFALTSEVVSRQRIEAGKIVSQEVVSEASRLTSGSNPPTLEVQLPETLNPGQTFAFDAIVEEPLEGRALMGVAVDEGVTSEDFLEPRPVVLDVLSAGGLYKLGTAPGESDQRWISAVILREDGLVIETRRVPIVENGGRSN